MTFSYSDLDLPSDVVDQVEYGPLERIIVPILRAGIPTIDVYSLIPEDIFDRAEHGDSDSGNFIVVRRVPGINDWIGDPRGLFDAGRIAIHVFTVEPNQDTKGAVVSEAVRRVLMGAWNNKTVVPGAGAIVNLEMIREPTRRPDFATSAGPVQYADLPHGMWRYESTYNVLVRPIF